VTTLVLAACNNNPTPDIKTPAVVTAAAQPGTGVQPTVAGISDHSEQCVTERPLALWETKGPALEEAVRCIDELPDHWWEEEEPELIWERDSEIQPVDDWLTTDEWEQFDAWLYGRASVHCQNESYFSGQGSQQMSGDELSELSTWVEIVYTRLTSSRSNWPDLPALALSCH
jgi:hypothetical protein